MSAFPGHPASSALAQTIPGMSMCASHGAGRAGEGVGPVPQGRDQCPAPFPVFPASPHPPLPAKRGINPPLLCQKIQFKGAEPPSCYKVHSFQHGLLCSTSQSTAGVLLQPFFGVGTTCCPKHPVREHQEENLGGRGCYLGMQAHGCVPGKYNPLLSTERQIPSFPRGSCPDGSTSSLSLAQKAEPKTNVQKKKKGGNAMEL